MLASVPEPSAMADTKNNSLLFQSSYYYIGHFSRFVRPGARRVACTSGGGPLEATAFTDVSGETSVIVLNRTEEDQCFALEIDGLPVVCTLPPRSIATYLT